MYHHLGSGSQHTLWTENDAIISHMQPRSQAFPPSSFYTQEIMQLYILAWFPGSPLRPDENKEGMDLHVRMHGKIII